MKFSGRYKGNTAVVVHSIPQPIIKNSKLSMEQIVRGVSDEFGPHWKVWVGGVKEEPMMIGKRYDV